MSPFKNSLRPENLVKNHGTVVDQHCWSIASCKATEKPMALVD